MIPKILSIFLDYKCNFECGHCSVGSSPAISMPMSLETMIKAIDSFSELNSSSVVCFTGGEATLSKRKLLLGLKHCFDKGLVTRLVTNGWWAKDKQKAKQYIQELKQNGLVELNTSYDEYHEPFMSFEPILNLVEEGLEQGLRVALSVVGHADAEYNGSRIKHELARRLNSDIDNIHKNFFFVEDFPAPVGTGENIDVSGMVGKEILDMGCMEIIKTLSVHPKGDVKACCGHTVFYTEDLILGNVHHESIGEIVGRVEQNAAYWLIHSLGPKRILEKMGVEGNYSHICHACNVLLTKYREEFLAYIKENKEDVYRENILLNPLVKNISSLYMNRNAQQDFQLSKRLEDSRRKIDVTVIDV